MRLSKDDIDAKIVELYKSGSSFRQLQKRYHKSPNYIAKLVKGIILKCPNCGQERQRKWKLCPFCTKSYPEEESLYERLRQHPIDYLPISERLKERVKVKFSTVGQILDASEEEVDEIYYVGTVRVKIIKTAAIEYMAG